MEYVYILVPRLGTGISYPFLEGCICVILHISAIYSNYVVDVGISLYPFETIFY